MDYFPSPPLPCQNVTRNQYRWMRTYYVGACLIARAANDFADLAVKQRALVALRHAMGYRV